MIVELLNISGIGDRFIRDYLYKVQGMTFLSHIECWVASQSGPCLVFFYDSECILRASISGGHGLGWAALTPAQASDKAGIF